MGFDKILIFVLACKTLFNNIEEFIKSSLASSKLKIPLKIPMHVLSKLI